MNKCETAGIVQFPGTEVQSDTTSSTSSIFERKANTNTDSIPPTSPRVKISDGDGNSVPPGETKLLWAAIGTIFGLVVALSSAMYFESKSLNQSINDTKLMVSESNLEVKESLHEFERRLWDKLDSDKSLIRSDIDTQKSEISKMKDSINLIEKDYKSD